MDLRIRGRKAVVTGGSRGIGRAIAETLAAEGADVAICARHAPQLEAAVAALKGHGVNAIGGMVDVADGAALSAWIRDAAQALGGIDILVCNPSADPAPSAEENWQRHFQTDLMGAVRAVEAAKPFLLQAAANSGDAAVVMIASVAAAQADQEDSYGPMKAALIHLAKGVARQQAPRQVRVNTVSPGTIYFDGGFWDRVRNSHPELFREYLGRNPLGRMGTVQDVASAAVFLASPVAGFITGSNLVVDGAFTARVQF